MSNENRSGRQSIWTVASGSARIYFPVFGILNILNAARVVLSQLTTQASYAGWSTLIDVVLDEIGGNALGIASLSIAIADTWRAAMVLGGLLEEWVNRRRERQMAEAVAEAVGEATTKARAEAIAENNALWRAWNDRRLDALGKGEPFDEPPPDISRASENGR